MSTYSRRDFLKTSGAGLTFAVVFGPMGVRAVSAESTDQMKETAFSAWVKINTDNSILIYSPASEMGQGSMTAVPIILAEEMDADWDHVRLEFSPTQPNIFGSGGGNAMVTGGSRTVRTYFPKVRRVGAQIRRVLLDNVAREWQVPVAELSTEPSTVVHSASGRKITYGEVAAFSEVPATMPSIDDSEFKAPQDYRLIGKNLPRRDIPAKTDGSAQFSIDVQVPGMVYGFITRSPVHDGSPKSFNEEEIVAMPGVLQTVELPYGIGVLGETLEQTLKAKEALRIEWAPGAVADGFDSVATLAGYSDIASDEGVATRTVFEQGDAAATMEKAVRTYEADYFSDHVNHAQLEPVNAIASVNPSGDGVELWAGTQAPWSAVTAAAEAINVSPDRVVLNRYLSGGGFGRKLNPDFVAEAALLSNAIKRPVKLIWTREDDLQYGFMRPMNLQRMKAGVDAEGNLIAWNHCIVGDDSPGMIAGGAEIPHYAIPNKNIEARHVESGVRHWYWRAVAHPFNKYAIESFIDEIAVGESKDPIEYRRMLMADDPKALRVIDLIVEMANKAGPAPDGRARGLSFAERGPSIAAAIAEISVDRNSGQIHVHRVWCGGDFGIIVQPDNAAAQMEGGMIFGLSSVLSERVTFVNGEVQQSNYRDYRIMTIDEAPEFEVAFVESFEDPVGIGELSNPLAGGAVANAFRALTGKNLRHTPFTPEKVLEVLG